MSREVDQRIVQMEFDNAKFERNVQKSMDSLEKLNQSLQLEGAEKGFEKIQDASDELDFIVAQTAIETLEKKFGALEIVGVAALTRLTNKVLDAGEKMVKSLSVDNVASGWSKYTQKTASVQTIVNATGKTVRQVNSYLDKLMWYSDETSYSFSDMTSSLSQLTAAGGDIDTLIPMIMGIANATAYAGKGASEFSRVIYNLNQSYSQGYLNLMDWKSVELAGVATAELKQLLIDTAVEMGKLKEGEVTIGTFGSTLSNKWADKTVMETAFGKLAEFTQAVEEAVDAGQYDTAAEAMEALADQYDETAVKAFQAAQEAKSFTEALEATKDAVASGWLDSFEIIFGDYEEAKSFWTNLASELWELFASGGEVRNGFLHDVFDSGMDKLLNDAGFGEDFEYVLQRVLTATGTVTEEAIGKAGSFRNALKGSNVSADELNATIGLMIQQLSELAALSDEELEALGTDGKKIDRTALEQQLSLYLSIGQAIQNGELSLSGYAEQMSTLSGREHFFNGLLNILQGIESVTVPIGKAFQEVFYASGSGVYEMLEGFDNFTAKLRLSEKSATNLKKIFKGVFSLVNTGLNGLKVIGKVGTAALSTILDVLDPVLDALMSGAGFIGNWLTLLDEALEDAENLGDVLDTILESIDGLLQPIKELWQGFWAFISTGDLASVKQEFGAFGVAAEAVTGILERLGPVGEVLLGILGGIVGLLGGAAGGLWSGVSGLLEGFGSEAEDFKALTLSALEWLKEVFTALPDAASEALSHFGATVQGVFTVIRNACVGAGEAFIEFFNLQNGVDLYRLLALMDVAALALAIYGVASALKALKKSMTSVLANPVTNLLNSMKSAIDAWKNTHTANNFAGIAKSISVSVALLAGSMWVLSTIEDPKKVTTSLNAILASLFGMISAFIVLSKLDMTGIASAKILATLTGFAVGMAAIGLAMKSCAKVLEKLAEIPFNKLNNAASIFALLAAVMGSIVATVALISSIPGVNMLGVAASLLSMAVAMGAITAAVVVMIGALTLMSNAVTDGGTLVLGGLGVALILAGVGTAISMITEAIAMIDWKGIALKILAKTAEMLMAGGAMLAVTGSIALIAAALLALVEILKKIGGIQVQARNIVASGMAILLIFTGVAGLSSTLAGIAEKANWTGIIEAAEASVLIAVSMVAMATAFKIIGQAISGMDVGTAVASSITFVTGLMALLAVVQALGKLDNLDNLDNLTAMALKLSAMLLILTPALKLLGLVSFEEAMTGVVTLAGILGILMGLGALTNAFPGIAVGIELIGVALKKLGEAFSAFAGGALKAALFVGAFAILANFAGPICDAITTAAPDIQNALIAIVEVVANVISASAPYLLVIITTLFKVVVQAIVDCIAWMWEGDGGEGAGIKGALDGLFSAIGEYISEKLTNWKPFSVQLIEFATGLDYDEYVKKLWGDEVGSLLLGENIADGLTKGMDSKEDELYAAGEKAAETVNEAVREASETHSPSRVQYQNGVWMALGLAGGLTDPEATSVLVQNATAMAQTVLDTVDEVLGIHSPSEEAKTRGRYTTLGEAEGLCEDRALATLEEAAEEVADTGIGILAKKTDAYYQQGKAAAEAYGEGFEAAGTEGENGELQLNSNGTLELDATLTDDTTDALAEAVKEGAEQGTSSGILGVNWFTNDTITNAVSGLLTGVTDRLGVNTLNESIQGLLGDTLGSLDDYISIWTDKDADGTTAAERIEEEYKTKLEANKLLSETAQQEYELWKTENQYSASTDELLAKKAEAAATDIANQTARVALVQEKYDKMVNQWGADKEETKEAYLDLVKEQTTLAELKADQYVDIFEEVSERYNTDLDVLEKEYGLWGSENEKTATKIDKLNRETEYMSEELLVREKLLNNAKEQYDTLVDEVGKDDQRTREAYAEYLDAQTEFAELQSDIARQELAIIEAGMDLISTAHSMSQSRIELLATAFDDGSLASREDDYKAAVEEYGEDSPEARKAQWQGTTSSILSVVSAMESMNYQMEQLRAYQKELDSGLLSVEEIEEIEAAMLSTQTSFVGYAENLADALDLEDTGKQITVKLAYAVQKNWQPITESFDSIWGKVTETAPDFAQKLAKALGTAFSEEGLAIGTEVINTINSAMQGDWQNALASGFVAALDFAGTELGQNLLQNGTTMLAQAGVDMGMSLLNVGEGLTALLGSGGVTGLLGGIAGMIPEILPIVGVVAAVGAGIAGVVALVKKWKSANEEATESAIDYPTEYANTIRESSSILEAAVDGVTETAMGIASAAALTLDALAGEEESWEPCITPVVDLTKVWDSADELQSGFAESMVLDANVSSRMAGSIGAKTEHQNGVIAQSNAELLAAINGLGAHMDGVAENIKGMEMVVDGKKAIGYIDARLGERTKRSTR